VAGGASEVQSYLTQIGITDIKIVNTEKEIGGDWTTQYDNWATPNAAVEMLRSIRKNWVADTGQEEKEMWLIAFMKESQPGPHRLKGLLPKGTIVAHKTGSSGTQNGITAATNDIGIIYLPNGNHVAIDVFVSDSPADEKTREAVIAKIAKAVWDRWSNATQTAH
jgi:beta-lactamase class A